MPAREPRLLLAKARAISWFSESPRPLATGGSQSVAGYGVRLPQWALAGGLLLVALDTGMRRGELHDLTIEMLDPEAGKICLPASITKTKQARYVYLQQGALKAVSA